MNTSNNQNSKSSGWKLIIASLSVTSLFGLINIFSNRDATKTGNDSNVDALLNLPIPTLVPVSAVDQVAPTTTLREVAQPVVTATPAKQSPVIESVVLDGGGSSSGSSSSSSPSTGTSSS